MKWWLFACLWMVTSVSATPRVASLNLCYDSWLATVLPTDWQVIPTTVHGNRLEALIELQADFIIAGSFTDARLLQQLARISSLHVIQQPNDFAEWQTEVRRFGHFIGHSERSEQWLQQQQTDLQDLSAKLQEVLIIMPNYYTWAQDSWVAQLLSRFSVTLVSPYQRGYLGQLRLEQLLALSAQRVVFEGFSYNYSRGQDWLYHPAVQRWLTDRDVGSIAAATASCPAVNAVDYLQQLVGKQEVTSNAY
jgi:ABC-type Fe3+-hydroxamate transport system substrate-binding protein